jgi:two-component system cell cycle response regulator DivK
MKKKVLIADDYEDSLSMMRFLLERYGLEVIEASDGKEAVRIAIAERPDLIMMDIGMPKMNGLEATIIIRQNHEMANVPIIAVTAFDKEVQDLALKIGCDDVLAKPIDLDRLGPIVRYYLG